MSQKVIVIVAALRGRAVRRRAPRRSVSRFAMR
jgi:hypothetical protein